MISRRTVLAAAAASASGAFMKPTPAAASGPSTVRTSLNFEVPPGACDAHVQVFPDPSRVSPNRSFTPPEANADDLLTLQKALRMDHVVIVNSTVYGATISPLLESIAALGQERARGIALFDPKLEAADLDALHRGGIQGIRVFLGLTARWTSRCCTARPSSRSTARRDDNPGGCALQEPPRGARAWFISSIRRCNGRDHRP